MEYMNEFYFSISYLYQYFLICPTSPQHIKNAHPPQKLFQSIIKIVYVLSFPHPYWGSLVDIPAPGPFSIVRLNRAQISFVPNYS